MAFVIDAYARRILGWRSSTSMTARLVLDAIEHAVWTRGQEGRPVAGVIQHHGHGSQHTSRGLQEATCRR
jgi:putative transposase